jgi:putative ABC transport system permease protein
MEGRIPSPQEKYKAVIGYKIWDGDLFGEKSLGVGDEVLIEDIEFKIVGVLEKIGSDQDDSSIYIPVETAQDMYNEKGQYDQLIARVRDGFDVEKVAEDIKEEMRDDRGQKEGEEDFTAQTSEQLMEMTGGILSAIQTVVVGISTISLLVGGIGIMNSMYTSVLERTREIGIMKALGATKNDIMEIFLVEAGMLGLVGGAVGALIGITLSKTVEYYSVTVLKQELLKASMAPEIILGAIFFSFVVGCISGVFPAIQASKLKPVEALRYE